MKKIITKKYTLITVPEFKDRFYHLATRPIEDIALHPHTIRIQLEYNDRHYYWVINEEMSRLMGKRLEFKEHITENYTHRNIFFDSYGAWSWHKLWFVETWLMDFIEEDEMMI